jgi:hypothetical protein
MLTFMGWDGASIFAWAASISLAFRRPLMRSLTLRSCARRWVLTAASYSPQSRHSRVSQGLPHRSQLASGILALPRVSCLPETATSQLAGILSARAERTGPNWSAPRDANASNHAHAAQSAGLSFAPIRFDSLPGLLDAMP